MGDSRELVFYPTRMKEDATRALPCVLCGLLIEPEVVASAASRPWGTLILQEAHDERYICSRCTGRILKTHGYGDAR